MREPGHLRSIPKAGRGLDLGPQRGGSNFAVNGQITIDLLTLPAACGVTPVSSAVEFHKTKANMYRVRADEMRTLADQLKNEEHKRLLFESAENYEKLAEIEVREIQRRDRFG